MPKILGVLFLTENVRYVHIHFEKKMGWAMYICTYWAFFSQAHPDTLLIKMLVR
jgi:hypothetical protein